MTNIVDVAVYVIFSQIKQGGNLEELVESYRDVATNQKPSQDELDEIAAKVRLRIKYDENRHHAYVEDPTIIADDDATQHIEWYPDWLADTNHSRYYWKKLEGFLEGELTGKLGVEKAGRAIQSIDKASDAVLRLLEDPSRKEFRTKGLVLGYVQSGKTANFTATIAKAVDAGYQLIVVLTGTHEVLRRQTQQRLDRELTGEVDTDVTHVEFPTVGHWQWERLTERLAEFVQPKRRFADSTKNPNPMLVVMKKNTRVMDKFISWVSPKATLRAPEAEAARRALALLVIDDEADQASIDTNANKDTDPTETNKRIRRILSLFPKHAYVGYTATPFANVLIDPTKVHEEFDEPLFPRNFIVSLPKPEGYFGADKMFDGARAKAYIRHVKPEDVSAVVPKGPRFASSVPNSIPPSLKKALNSFIIAGAIRLSRGQADKPSTMLVHTTPYQRSHRLLWDLLREEVKGLKGLWNDLHEQPKLESELRYIFDEDFDRWSAALSNEFGNASPDWNSVIPEIGVFLEQLKVYELNSQGFDNLDYTETPEIKVLAIGGNKLSRGLTLEGLVVSYYLRRSREYDTLLQMGRWFGYRQGYEDLTRVYTTEELEGWFRDLALVEAELREEIKVYEDQGITPRELAPRIRAHSSMRVTARNKMGAAKELQGSFSRSLRQTIWFELDKSEKLRRNIRSTIDFIDKLSFEQHGSHFMAKAVDGKLVLAYLDEYKFVQPGDTGGPGLDADGLKEYVRRLMPKGELKKWNVVVISQKSGNGEIPLTEMGNLKVIPVERSRLKTEHGYKIGVTSDPAHLKLDLKEDASDIYDGRTDPLLLIYRISKDSKPKDRPIKPRDRPKTRDELLPLFDSNLTKVDVIALVFVLPQSKAEPYSYVGQNFDS